MHAPAFWLRDGVLARVLSPISPIVAAATARRVARPGWRAPVPVVCCGNASVGGSGKTTLALDIGARLIRRGARIAFLTRGYRGQVHGTLRVGLGAMAADVGDEALLLAALAPTFVGADRAASARAALGVGATVLVMDDGLQNPTLIKDLSFLVIDSAAGFGNGRVLPAGPLREPVSAAAARCQAAVVIGNEPAGPLPGGLPILRAWLTQDAPELAGKRVLAFAGIGRPSKFFATLNAAGVDVVQCEGFPDHHRYKPAELQRLQQAADAAGAVLVTTPKDAVRLPAGWGEQVAVANVSLTWQDPAQIDALLGGIA